MRRVALLALTALLALVALSAGAAATGTTASSRGSASPALGIRHVFLIVIENESYDATYVHNRNGYLGHTLQQQGTLLTRYYATGHDSLDNYLAMISGQAPNALTSADCRSYTAFNGGGPAALDRDGQAVGSGCVYPSNVMTLADQLQAGHVSWHGFMEDMGRTPSRERARCGQPVTTVPDDTQRATAGDQYAARHNPFVYFSSLVGSGLCRQNVVPLTSLAGALTRTATTPELSFITPNLCDDGHDSPCAGTDAAGSSAGGLVSVDHFLRRWVPRIEQSPAFRKDGLLLITSDEADAGDSSSCCGERPGPDDAEPGITGPGGGRIGALAIGRCVPAGRTDPTAYNHYSLLRSLEDLYGVRTGGTDGRGHLGFAGAAGVASFGKDLFAGCRDKPGLPAVTAGAAAPAVTGRESTPGSGGGLSTLGAVGLGLGLFAMAGAWVAMARHRRSR